MGNTDINKIKIIFQYCKDVYKGNINANDAAFKLETDEGVNSSSAKMYFEIYKSMINGTCYKRATSILMTEYFLRKIYEENGIEKLNGALKATIEHRNYMSQASGQSYQGIFDLCKKIGEEFGIKTIVEENESYNTNLIVHDKSKNYYVTKSESKMIEENKNLILYGPPGTGKTFNVVNKALEIINPIRYSDMMRNNCSREELSNEFNKLLEIGQISFCTFHQSYSYEDFVEGLRSDEEWNGFAPKDGIFKQICKTASEKIEKRGSKYEFDEDAINFYKMSLGSKDSDYDIYKYCIENDCIALGKGGDVDYKNCSSKEEIKNEYLKQYPSAKSDEFDIDAMNRFKLWMEKDDIVIISYGNLKARAIGKVTGDYFYDPNTEICYRHFRNVEWLYVSDGIDVKRILNEKKFSQQSVYQFYKEDLNIENIKELISSTEISNEEKKYVLIIDEINRGNISKIFGELITLIEEDKRLGEKNQIKVTLPYSNESFGVPSNLYIIGTMNTADRSIALLDTALRRRFEFIEYMPNPELLSENVDGINLRELLKVINKRIEFLFDIDHTIGHAFFIKDNLDFEGIVEIMNKKIIPLLQEYFYGDFEKIELILGGAGKPGDDNYFISKEEVNPGKLFNKKNIFNEYPTQYKYTIVGNPTKDAFINLYSNVGAED